MKLYLSLVQNDWANKSSSTPRHLTSVDKVLQFANLHRALKPSGQRFGSVHRSSSHKFFSEAATDTLGCNPHPFCLEASSQVSKLEDTSFKNCFCCYTTCMDAFLSPFLYFERPAARYVTESICRSWI